MNPAQQTEDPTSALSRNHLHSVPLAHPMLAPRIKSIEDREGLHQAVMSLFPAHLPGPATAKRAASTVLYRVEPRGNTPRILIQASTDIRYHDHGIRSTSLAGLANNLRPGQRIHLLVDINAVRCQSRTGRRIPIPAEELQQFLLDPTSKERPGLLDQAITDLHILESTTYVHHQRGTPLRISTISAQASIAHPGELAHKIVTGIGRAKAYGCGMLCVIPTP